MNGFLFSLQTLNSQMWIISRILDPVLASDWFPKLIMHSPSRFIPELRTDAAVCRTISKDRSFPRFFSIICLIFHLDFRGNSIPFT